MSIQEQKIANPLKFYSEPEDVAHDKHLSLEEKIKVLDNWLNDIDLHAIADDENMQGKFKDRRQHVDYLRRLLRTYRAHQAHNHQKHH